MSLTDENLVCEEPNRIGGIQRIYRFKYGHGLSVINSPMLHNYPFAWEIAVIRGVKNDGSFECLDYGTELTSDVEVFKTDAEANAFIAKAKRLFDKGGIARAVLEVKE